MDFWGFIILDGRRIGYDLWLYKEVGTTKIAYDKRELKAQLGEDNFFTDNQSEYKKHVNQYIFGFRKEEQYEQYIKLLVKVRAPKLSKEFKPTKVYEILNDSLQTLTDEDLRAMVDAMEKMDEIQDSLDMLNRAFADVKIIRNEYTRYNQYMLAKKAQRYIAKKQEVEEAQKNLDSLEQKKLSTENEQRDKKQRLEELGEQIKLAETERNSLLDTNLEEADLKLSQAKVQKEEAEKNEKRWEEKIQDYNEKIREGERQLKEIKSRLEQRQQELEDRKQELEEQQETLQWEQHGKAVSIIGAEEYGGTEEITRSLDMLKKLIEECKNAIRQYEELARQYDEIAAQLEEIKRQKIEKEDKLELAQEQVVSSIDQWITDIFEREKNSAEWHPEKEVLEKTQEIIRQYQSVNDAGKVQELLRGDYERQRQALTDAKNDREYERKIKAETLEQTKAELESVQKQEELEPLRDENTELSRKALQNAGITAVPFYKTVEFAENMDAASCARLEAQLERMGILDALVVAAEDYDRISGECPEFLDAILYVKEKGNSEFSKLVTSDDLDNRLKETVSRILSNMYEKEGAGQGVYIGKDGCFVQGILAGKANKDGEAEYVGVLARKRRKEQRILKLQEEIRILEEAVAHEDMEIRKIQSRIEKLWEEYQKLPGFEAINKVLDNEKECNLALQIISAEYDRKEAEERRLADNKNKQYQTMLKLCKPFPYGRTLGAYEEVSEAIEEYRNIWQEVRSVLQQISTERINYTAKEDRIAEQNQEMDEAFREKRNYSTKVKEFDILVKQYEAYLNSPEIKEKAERLKEIREALFRMNEECNVLNQTLAVLADRLQGIMESEPKNKERLQGAIAEETHLRSYFEEELSLKLVIDRGSRTLFDCAREAVGIIRESDKNRESTDLLNSLYQVYQKHNGSLASYGTALEDCFDTVDEVFGASDNGNVLRKRVRVVSVWNGKKVYLEEFYDILKTSIDETELLIQKKDRELFEDILSQTISQQLTDRIAESRKWVADMSQLMKEMDTSMGLSFSLDWKPCKAENDAELDTVELEQILLRDRALLTIEDIEKVAAHFRSKIRMEKQRLEEDGGVINYMELVRDALDYRKWFEFQMFYRRGEEIRKPLTNAAFNRFSGGEKAMAMYVPLFAAVNAQYKKAENEDHPRMIALDEAFAGVDDKNISSMFELVQKLDFDYIMNSQALWGCFETVKGLRIAELLRPQNSQVVSVIRYTWNGHERILDEQ